MSDRDVSPVEQALVRALVSAIVRDLRDEADEAERSVPARETGGEAS